MRRNVVLALTVVFILGLAGLTVTDFVNHGITVVGVLAIGILVLFSVGIVGALRHPPEE
jgi:hypothetical protein